MVRLGFIIGFIALIGSAALRACGLSRPRSGAGDRRHRAGARDRRSCQPGAGPADRARTAGPGRVRPVPRAVGGQGRTCCSRCARRSMPSRPISSSRLDRAAQAGRARCRAQGACAAPDFPIRRSAISTTSRSTPRALDKPIDVLMDVEPRNAETMALPGRALDQQSDARADAGARAWPRASRSRPIRFRCCARTVRSASCWPRRSCQEGATDAARAS